MLTNSVTTKRITATFAATFTLPIPALNPLLTEPPDNLVVPVLLAPVLLRTLRLGSSSCAKGHTQEGVPQDASLGGHCTALALPPSAVAPAELPRRGLPPSGQGCSQGCGYSGSLDPASNHTNCTGKAPPFPSSSALARRLPRASVLALRALHTPRTCWLP